MKLFYKQAQIVHKTRWEENNNKFGKKLLIKKAERNETA